MSRNCIPFSTGDMSALARSLRNQLTEFEGPPSHVQLLHMLARGVGFRNYQSLRASHFAQNALAAPGPAAADYAQVQRAVRHFDGQGRLATWPARFNLQLLSLWVMWSKLPPREALSEEQLNRILRAHHTFGDHVLLRRELCDAKMLSRTPDGREYQRIERTPPAEGLALIRHLGSHNGRTK